MRLQGPEAGPCLQCSTFQTLARALNWQQAFLQASEEHHNEDRGFPCGPSHVVGEDCGMVGKLLGTVAMIFLIATLFV